MKTTSKVLEPFTYGEILNAQMTPREKAKELVGMYNQIFFAESFNSIKMVSLYETAKLCALIGVTEILNGAMIWNKIEGKSRIFWNEVKEEIEKL